MGTITLVWLLIGSGNYGGLMDTRLENQFASENECRRAIEYMTAYYGGSVKFQCQMQAVQQPPREPFRYR